MTLDRRAIIEKWGKDDETGTSLVQDSAIVEVVDRREERGYHIWTVHGRSRRATQFEAVTLNGTGWFLFPDFTELQPKYLKAMQAAWRRWKFEDKTAPIEDSIAAIFGEQAT